MATWNISSDVKKKILDLTKGLDNDKRVLFILKNLGPQRFVELENYCDISRSTVSKYVKLHVEQKNVEKRIYTDKNVSETRYFITKRGETELNEDMGDEGELFYINELNENLVRLSDLVDFYRVINLDETIIFQIVRIVLKIGEKFFLLDQNRELYLTLFYIVNYNSILTPDYKLNIDQFCEFYDVKNLYINYYVDKIMSSNLGFYMFVRGKDTFFFHGEDLLGTTTLRLVKDHLIEEMIHINLIGEKKFYDLDEESKKLTEKLKEMRLIWDAIKEQFEILIKKLIIKMAIEMGVSKTFLTDLVVQSEKLLESREEQKTLLNIIEGSERFEDLNIVTISDKEEEEDEEEKKHLEEILAQLKGKGFCPVCGKIVLENDFSNRCSKCGNEFDPKDLLNRIDAANEASKRFKEESMLEEKLIKCPNPDCELPVLPSWDICPHCDRKL